MRCISCGKEIPSGNVYCPICGKEAQIISDTSVLEEDLLKILMEEGADRPEGDAGSNRIASASEVVEKTDPSLQRKKQAERKRKKKRKKRLCIILVVVICLVCVGVFFGVRNSLSYDTLYKKAEVAYHTERYEEAIEKTEKALEKEPESQEAWLLYGDIYAAQEDLEQAEACYKKVLDLNPANEDAYRELLKMYDGTKDYEAIRALSMLVPADHASLNKLFAQYLIAEPTVNIPGGSYTEPLKLEFSAKRGLRIYYTLDGTAPSASSELYEKTIEINKKGSTVVQAIAIDQEGNVSDILREEYILTFEAPSAPRISPDGGEFVEGGEIKITAQSGTTIYYTWDGSKPDQDASLYEGAIDIPEGNHVLSAIAIDDKTGEKSEISRANFIFFPPTEEDVVVTE